MIIQCNNHRYFIYPSNPSEPFLALAVKAKQLNKAHKTHIGIVYDGVYITMSVSDTVSQTYSNFLKIHALVNSVSVSLEDLIYNGNTV